jgi:starch phosphorylase
MKRSIKTLAPVFNTDRMVQEYTERFYIPNARRARSFSENGYELGIRVADYKRFIRNNWHHVKIVNVDDRWKDPDNGAAGGTASAMEQAHTGGPLKRVTAAIFFGPIWPPDTAVELIYYEENGGAWDPVVVQMEQVQELENKTYLYQSAIPAHLIHGPHFSVRVRPISPSFVHAFELPLVAST